LLPARDDGSPGGFGLFVARILVPVAGDGGARGDAQLRGHANHESEPRWASFPATGAVPRPAIHRRWSARAAGAPAAVAAFRHSPASSPRLELPATVTAFPGRLRRLRWCSAPKKPSHSKIARIESGAIAFRSQPAAKPRFCISQLRSQPDVASGNERKTSAASNAETASPGRLGFGCAFAGAGGSVSASRFPGTLPLGYIGGTNGAIIKLMSTPLEQLEPTPRWLSHFRCRWTVICGVPDGFVRARSSR